MSDKGRGDAYFAAPQPDTLSLPGWLHFDISRILQSGHRDSLRKREEMSDHDHVTDVALSLCKIYLSCKDAFPTPQMKEDWEAIVWREACVKAGANLELFSPYELARPIPTTTWRVLTISFSLQTVT